MIEEKLRWFWMGKTPRLRKAIEYYIGSILNEDWETKPSVAKTFRTSTRSMTKILKKIRDNEEIYEHYFGEPPSKESLQHIIGNKKRELLEFKLIPVSEKRVGVNL